MLINMYKYRTDISSVIWFHKRAQCSRILQQRLHTPVRILQKGTIGTCTPLELNKLRSCLTSQQWLHRFNELESNTQPSNIVTSSNPNALSIPSLTNLSSADGKQYLIVVTRDCTDFFMLASLIMQICLCRQNVAQKTERTQSSLSLVPVRHKPKR